MSKIITVNGPPACGKSTVALKLAQELYHMTHKPVLYLSADLIIPCMGVIFPYSKQSKLQSLGGILDKVDIYQEDIMAHTVTSKYMENFGYIGYKTGEDQFTYPTPTDGKIRDMFASMMQIAEYIVVDCDRDQNDQISSLARGLASVRIQIVNPDLRSMSFYSNNPIPEDTMKVMNIMDRDIYLPIEETVNHFRGVTARIPYSQQAKQQSYDGTLPQFVKDPTYRLAMARLAKEVVNK